jgi:hypothetical protein
MSALLWATMVGGLEKKSDPTEEEKDFWELVNRILDWQSGTIL